MQNKSYKKIIAVTLSLIFSFGQSLSPVMAGESSGVNLVSGTHLENETPVTTLEDSQNAENTTQIVPDDPTFESLSSSPLSAPTADETVQTGATIQMHYLSYSYADKADHAGTITVETNYSPQDLVVQISYWKPSAPDMLFLAEALAPSSTTGNSSKYVLELNDLSADSDYKYIIVIRQRDAELTRSSAQTFHTQPVLNPDPDPKKDTFDSRGRLTERTNAEGHLQIDWGNKTAVHTTEDGNTDHYDDVIEIANGILPPSPEQIDGRVRIDAYTNPSGALMIIFGRILSREVHLKDGSVQYFDANDRIIRQVGGDSLKTTLDFKYDERGELTEIRKTFGALMIAVRMDTIFDFKTKIATETLADGTVRTYSFTLEKRNSLMLQLMAQRVLAPGEFRLGGWTIQGDPTQGDTIYTLSGLLTKTVLRDATTIEYGYGSTDLPDGGRIEKGIVNAVMTRPDGRVIKVNFDYAKVLPFTMNVLAVESALSDLIHREENFTALTLSRFERETLNCIQAPCPERFQMTLESPDFKYQYAVTKQGDTYQPEFLKKEPTGVNQITLSDGTVEYFDKAGRIYGINYANGDYLVIDWSDGENLNEKSIKAKLIKTNGHEVAWSFVAVEDDPINDVNRTVIGIYYKSLEDERNGIAFKIRGQWMEEKLLLQDRTVEYFDKTGRIYGINYANGDYLVIDWSDEKNVTAVLTKADGHVTSWTNVVVDTVSDEGRSTIGIYYKSQEDYKQGIYFKIRGNEQALSPGIKVREMITADILKTFGFTDQALKDLMDRGLVKIEVDLKALKVVVTIDPSVKLTDWMVNLADLLGSSKLPGQIEYQLHESTQPLAACAVLPDGTLSCPPPVPPYLVSGNFQMGNKHFVLSYVEENAAEGYGDNRLRSVKIYDGDPWLVCIQAPCPTGKLIKEIIYRQSDTRIGDELFAHVVYHDGSQGEVASRDVQMRRMEDSRYHIQTATDLDKKGQVMAVSKFEYDVAIPNCAKPVEGGVLSGCLGAVILRQITRIDASGELLSTIQDIHPAPVIAVVGQPAAYEATIVLANRQKKQVTFQTLEELLLQALRNEIASFPTEKSEIHARNILLSQFPGINPNLVQVVSIRAVTAGDLSDGTQYPANFVGRHFVTLRIGQSGASLTYIGGFDASTNASMAIPTKSTLDYLDKVSRVIFEAQRLVRVLNAENYDLNGDGIVSAADANLAAASMQNAITFSVYFDQGTVLALDRDKNGQLDSQDYQLVVTAFNTAVDEIRKVMERSIQFAKNLDAKNYDMDSNGRVNAEDLNYAIEAANLAVKYQQYLNSEIRNILDVNHDEKLDEADVQIIAETIKNRIDGTIRIFDVNGNLLEESRPDGTKILYQYTDESGESVFKGITFVDSEGNKIEVNFEVSGLSVEAARAIAVTVMDLITKGDIEDGAVVFVSDFVRQEDTGDIVLTLRDADYFYQYKLHANEDSDTVTYEVEQIAKTPVVVVDEFPVKKAGLLQQVDDEIANVTQRIANLETAIAEILRQVDDQIAGIKTDFSNQRASYGPLVDELKMIVNRQGVSEAMKTAIGQYLMPYQEGKVEGQYFGDTELDKMINQYFDLLRGTKTAVTKIRLNTLNSYLSSLRTYHEKVTNAAATEEIEKLSNEFPPEMVPPVVDLLNPSEFDPRPILANAIGKGWELLNRAAKEIEDFNPNRSVQDLFDSGGRLKERNYVDDRVLKINRDDKTAVIVRAAAASANAIHYENVTEAVEGVALSAEQQSLIDSLIRIDSYTNSSEQKVIVYGQISSVKVIGPNAGSDKTSLTQSENEAELENTNMLDLTQQVLETYKNDQSQYVLPENENIVLQENLNIEGDLIIPVSTTLDVNEKEIHVTGNFIQSEPVAIEDNTTPPSDNSDASGTVTMTSSETSNVITETSSGATLSVTSTVTETPTETNETEPNDTPEQNAAATINAETTTTTTEADSTDTNTQEETTNKTVTVTDRVNTSDRSGLSSPPPNRPFNPNDEEEKAKKERSDKMHWWRVFARKLKIIAGEEGYSNS